MCCVFAVCVLSVLWGMCSVCVLCAPVWYVMWVWGMLCVLYVCAVYCVLYTMCVVCLACGVCSVWLHGGGDSNGGW